MKSELFGFPALRFFDFLSASSPLVQPSLPFEPKHWTVNARHRPRDISKMVSHGKDFCITVKSFEVPETKKITSESLVKSVAAIAP